MEEKEKNKLSKIIEWLKILLLVIDVVNSFIQLF